jgi:hypothetical protein
LAICLSRTQHCPRPGQQDASAPGFAPLVPADRSWPRGLAKDKARIDARLEDIAPGWAKKFHRSRERTAAGVAGIVAKRSILQKNEPRPEPGSVSHAKRGYLLPAGGLRLANRRICVLPSGAFTNTGCVVVT